MKGSNIVGIIGGVGPQATVNLYDMIVRLTDACKDQSHIDMIIYNHASIPDRSEYILGKSSKNPLPYLIEDIKQLESLGVKYMLIPCNTAHYFYDELLKHSSVPIINMVDETINFILKANVKKVGILATSGTLETRLYQNKLLKHGIGYNIPSPEEQQALMYIIYECLKSNKSYSIGQFYRIIENMKLTNCDAVILGCTELSIIKRQENLNKFYIDTLEILAKKAITLSGYKVKDYTVRKKMCRFSIK